MNAIAPAAPSLAAWDKVQIARHPQRPHTLDYIRRLCPDFFELRGDRSFGDDQALIGGVGRTALGPIVLLGHQKGVSTKENLRHNFGMPHPEGYRKALRLMQYAEKFNFPVVCLLDTPGAAPSLAAEERGQARAIAQSILTMTSLATPIIAVVTGEGSSGGALAVGVCDRLLMLEHSIYSVASPEASATILWRDATKAADAAQAMKITAQDLFSFGLVDEIIAEPDGGAHLDRETAIADTIAAILRQLDALHHLNIQHVLCDRYSRYRSIGAVHERLSVYKALPTREAQPALAR
jgi:acetyl-CoA carboxylase carboxyl transferase subunit alpha